MPMAETRKCAVHFLTPFSPGLNITRFITLLALQFAVDMKMEI